MTSCLKSPKEKDELFRKAGGYRVRVKSRRYKDNCRSQEKNSKEQQDLVPESQLLKKKKTKLINSRTESCGISNT